MKFIGYMYIPSGLSQVFNLQQPVFPYKNAGKRKKLRKNRKNHEFLSVLLDKNAILDYNIFSILDILAFVFRGGFQPIGKRNFWERKTSLMRSHGHKYGIFGFE